jgi:hypothetical protein
MTTDERTTDISIARGWTSFNSDAPYGKGVDAEFVA